MNDPQPVEILSPGDVAQSTLPALIGGSPRAVAALEDWFYGEVANDNTRRAYGRAIGQFTAWARQRGYQLPQMRAPQVRDYLNDMKADGKADATIKQHLAAIREVFNALMRAGEIEVNPAYSVKGPKLIVREGKTPHFSAEQARQFLDSIGRDTLKDKRDRALVSLLLYSFARVSAAVGMAAIDYFPMNDSYQLRIKEKGGKPRTLPAHSALVAAMADYLDAAGIRGSTAPLFQTTQHGKLTGQPMSRFDAYQMIRTRAAAAGLEQPGAPPRGNHSMRASGITAFLDSGGALDLAQEIAGHADSRTTTLYDRRGDRVNQGEIERIRI